jgi:hypothetical protein
MVFWQEIAASQKRSEITVSKELIDGLRANDKKPEDLIGEDGLLRPPTKDLVERAQEAEMAEYLGYAKNESVVNAAGNIRNGTSRKTLKGDLDELSIEIPRDRHGSFEPHSSQAIKQRRLPRRLWKYAQHHTLRYAIPESRPVIPVKLKNRSWPSGIPGSCMTPARPGPWLCFRPALPATRSRSRSGRGCVATRRPGSKRCRPRARPGWRFWPVAG